MNRLDWGTIKELEEHHMHQEETQERPCGVGKNSYYNKCYT